jgi:hypothetical protein
MVEWLSPLRYIEYLYLFTAMPYVGVPDTDELEAAARMLAVVLSDFGCSAKEPCV